MLNQPFQHLEILWDHVIVTFWPTLNPKRSVLFIWVILDFHLHANSEKPSTFVFHRSLKVCFKIVRSVATMEMSLIKFCFVKTLKDKQHLSVPLVLISLFPLSVKRGVNTAQGRCEIGQFYHCIVSWGKSSCMQSLFFFVLAANWAKQSVLGTWLPNRI